MSRNLAAGVEAFTSNVFALAGERPALVDAGNDFDVVGAARAAGLEPEVLALTHTHPDHVGELAAVREAFDPEVVALDGAFDGVDRALADGETVRLGDHEFTVLHTPGHEPNHACLYAPEPGVLYAGDLVFAGGAFGRTDLEGADRRTLVESIDRILETVDEDLAALYPGHGQSVTDGAYGTIRLARQAAGR